MQDLVTTSVPLVDDGVRLDVFLSRHPKIGSRSRAKELIDAGHVVVAGARAKPGLFLGVGQEVQFDAAGAPLPPSSPEEGLPVPTVPVLFADPWILVIDKPVGLAAHPPEDRSFRGHTVASWARAMFGELPDPQGEGRPGVVHRLDRETSGVMVLARNEEAWHWLRAQFKTRTVHKEYRAIAFGEARFDSDWIERPMAADPAHPDRQAVVTEGGREASTFYEVIERFDGFTHFRCLPKTGRTHQIRVHMASVGHSLVSDRLYRSRRAQHALLPREAPDPGRHCLHALRLQLPHPGTHEPVEFEAPLPADMTILLRWLRANRPFRRA